MTPYEKVSGQAHGYSDQELLDAMQSLALLAAACRLVGQHTRSTEVFATTTWYSLAHARKLTYTDLHEVKLGP
jgi:hypothetical protein